MSPWGEHAPTLKPYLLQPDLSYWVRELDQEAATSSLAISEQAEGRLADDTPYVLRAYEGEDALGREVSAVRVAVPRGIILALGPSDAMHGLRDEATRFVPALDLLVPEGSDRGGVATSRQDLSGDGKPDIIVRSRLGRLALWSLDSAGANPHASELPGRPAALSDIDSDGRVELVSEIGTQSSDPIGPRFFTYASHDGIGFTWRAPSVRREHERLAARRRAQEAASTSERQRLRALLEGAWYELAAGEPLDRALERPERARVPPELQDSFERHLQTLREGAVWFEAKQGDAAEPVQLPAPNAVDAPE